MNICRKQIFSVITCQVKTKWSLNTKYNSVLINLMDCPWNYSNTRSLNSYSKVKQKYIQLKKQEFKVFPNFGKFEAVGSIDYIIKGIDPQLHPNADRAFVILYGVESLLDSSVLNVTLTGDNDNQLNVTTIPSMPSLDYYCEVHLPLKYDLEINLAKDACLHIEDLECDEIKVNTENGNLVVKKLNFHNLRLNTHSGSLLADGGLKGNLYVNAKNTTITAKRLQGLKMNIQAENLEMNIQSSYIDASNITANNANLQLNNLHGSTCFAIHRGNLSIGGLDGHIECSLGSVDTKIKVQQLSKDSSVNIADGHLELSLLDQSRQKLKISSPEIVFTDEIKGDLSKTDDGLNRFTVNTKNDPNASELTINIIEGSTDVKLHDWLSTLSLKSV